MKRLLLAVFLLAGPAPALAQGVPNTAQVTATCGTTPTPYSAGLNYPLLQNTTGQQCINATVTVTPAGTQDTNTKQVNGATVNVGAGAAGSGTQRVTTSTDSTIGTVTSVTSATVVQPTAASLNATVIGTGTFATQVTSSVPAVGITPTDHTITSATGSSQTVMGANASRHSLTIENTGNANCGINPTGGTAVIGGAGTITLAPLGAYSPRIPTLSAVTAICTGSQPLYANEN